MFIAVDYCLKELEAEGHVDVYSTVLYLRKFRKNMVRTLVGNFTPYITRRKWIFPLSSWNIFDCLEQLLKLKFQKKLVFHNIQLLRQSLTRCVVCILTVSVPACIWVYSHVSTVWDNSGVRSQVPWRSLQTGSQRPQGQDVRLRKRIPGTCQVQGLKFILISR